ncbi:MAG: TetR/AcrR family transcriptional regulator [Alphaproteobacteria bacterium]|jgi:AcrR family transcriptional regulator|nr:TetR/AcrR family transcriptional regulator [Alphaproteobacteria bacterium]MDP6591386.1 TetR/AcrR family transcriptional regulator [Alphaproteobacteria bacterium]MDP6818299.1 TetR/AcrR family transcriptional regulator [Alphaproteobacteria bacterium]|tara:strand:- start:46 stop:711 length:666 start_codon:yes stop_codon:yes gene_type:complete
MTVSNKSSAALKRKSPGKRAYHHGNLRRALLDAALAMVEKEGPRGVSLRAVARFAGVSPAAPYRHFAGKEGLLAAVAEEGFRALESKMRAACGETDGLALAEFRAIGYAYVRFAASNPSHFRVMFGPEISDKSEHPSLREASDKASQIIADAIAKCQRPDLEGGDTDPHRLFISAWATFHGLATLIVDGQLSDSVGSDAELEALGNSVTDVIYRGLSFSGL